MPRYFGLDLHKRYVHGCEWKVDQQKRRHFRFPNTDAGWATFVQQLHADDEVALEVTGNAFTVHDLLSAYAGKVLLANPLELKRLGAGRHTDRVDAERLAKMLALGMVPAVWVPPREVRDVRCLLQYRDRLIRNRRRYLTQAKSVCQRHGLALPRNVDPRQWLSREEVCRLPQADRVILLSALRQLEAVDTDLQAVEAEIARQVADQPAVQLLLTITGVGLITAATIWAYLGDPSRFRTAKQVTRYAGLDASVHQSGEKDHRGRISRNGCKLLRTALVEAALAVARHDQGPWVRSSTGNSGKSDITRPLWPWPVSSSSSDGACSLRASPTGRPGRCSCSGSNAAWSRWRGPWWTGMPSARNFGLRTSRGHPAGEELPDRWGLDFEHR